MNAPRFTPYPQFNVVRLDDGEILRSGLHRAAAETLAGAWNRILYNKGVYCEAQPTAALAKAGQS